MLPCKGRRTHMCLAIILSWLLGSLALANVPAAYLACEGAKNSDNCQLPGPRYGNCVLDTLCEDPQTTDVNECLLCVDGCWDLPPGSFCLQGDGADGVCRKQDRCTTDPEKSFDQCNWCVSGDVQRTDVEDGGCQQTGRLAYGPWILLGLIALYQVTTRSRCNSKNT